MKFEERCCAARFDAEGMYIPPNTNVLPATDSSSTRPPGARTMNELHIPPWVLALHIVDVCLFFNYGYAARFHYCYYRPQS